MKFTGTVLKYGDNVDTDVIIPARYLNTIDKKELASHCMEDIDRDFVKKVKAGDIMVAGNNFGCGSSREHAPIAIKESGISLVIAKSFARIFYRNAINIGLAIIECPEAAEAIAEGAIFYINGEERARIALGDMRYTPDHIVSHLSECMTLRIGDLIYLGAPTQFEAKAGDNYRLTIGNHTLLNFDIK